MFSNVLNLGLKYLLPLEYVSRTNTADILNMWLVQYLLRDKEFDHAARMSAILVDEMYRKKRKSARPSHRNTETDFAEVKVSLFSIISLPCFIFHIL